MKLKEFKGILPIGGEAAGEAAISGLSSDSRKVSPGDLFFALAGSKADGAAFAGEAASRGAAAIVAAAGANIADPKVPLIVVDDPRRALALSAARFFGKQPETVAAVTGTSGETSVAAFARQIFAAAGHEAASIGTIGVVSRRWSTYGTLTTPDPVAFHAALDRLANDGVSHAAVEASSQGLDQRRVDGLRIAAAAFTNLGRDHMDYHPTVEHYMAAKMRLFDTLLPKGAPALIFSDDEWSKAAIEAATKAGLDVRTVGRKGAYICLKRVEHFRHKQMAEVHVGDDIYEIHIPLAGDFQVANALVAAGLAMSTGVAARDAMAALGHLVGASGRLELVGHTKTGALAYVDYAHKPDALENVLSSVRPFTSGRIIVVFGCGGDRDKGKRPIMGEIATRLADVVIVTDDNPRSEVPEVIRSEIMAAAKGATEIGDRAEAIGAAVAMLSAGDTLIVAGKGHEEGQTIGSVTLPFSDHAELRKALEELDR
jgi:UDP-N-acetylmuramoyl-L-alanyl-D-glutamate--2,6-diaminopimelate ligase